MSNLMEIKIAGGGGASLARQVFFLLYSLLLLPASRHVSSTSDNDDLAALLAFKSTISGDPSGTIAAWNTTTSFCRWPGVSCAATKINGQMRVTSLNLASLGLTGTISPALTNMSSLLSIDLSGNNLHGVIPHDLSALTHLEKLNLSSNSLQGSIPATICKSNSLQNLSLGHNNLQGDIPENLGACTGLKVLTLSNNMLQGTIPPSLGNLSNLVNLDLSTNNLAGEIPPTLGGLANLYRIDLSTNLLVGDIPNSFWNLSSLLVLSLYNNRKLTGPLPKELGTYMPRLKYLLIYQNQFTGEIPDSLSNISSLLWIEMYQNNLTGRVPSSLGSLPELMYLLLGVNNLGAAAAGDLSFISALTNCTYLQKLTLEFNNFGGSIPSSVGNLSVNLEFLELGQNQISGFIPPDIGNLAGLSILDLEVNNLQGSIPGEVLGNLTSLMEIYIGGNEFTGNIPASLGKCKLLYYMDVGDNKLTGTIPPEIFAIPSFSDVLRVAYNLLSGPLPEEIGKMESLRGLDVSWNRFSGPIPSSIGNCQQLLKLSLMNNSFNGSIPKEFESLKRLTLLDLSLNNLTGPIPAYLASFNFSYLNLSFNDFEGEVPGIGIFANASVVSIVGNSKLCGGNPDFGLAPCPVINPSKKRNNKTKIAIIVASLAVGVLSLALLLGFFVYRRTRMRGNGVAGDDSGLKDIYNRVSYAELLKATNGFSPANLIGAGSFGSVYKGVLDQRDEQYREIAVKVLNLEQYGASQSFMAECESLRSVRHRNLLKILTACSSTDFEGNDFKALVFEFMPEGNLDEWIHASGEEEEEGERLKRLSLSQRLNIAIDVASAVNYLHHEGPAPIIHCDLKPSNVLLDGNLSARVGDFGLARFLPAINHEESSSQIPGSSTAILKGSIGYIPPEYGMGSKVSTQGDVYSFGILLLEMLTGKRPTDDAFKDGRSLRGFVKSNLPDQVMEIVDPSLLYKVEIGGERSVEECLASLLNIGIRCTEESPTARIPSGDVVGELHYARNAFMAANGEIGKKRDAKT